MDFRTIWNETQKELNFPKLLYHNFEHTNSFDWDSCPSLDACWAAILHDILYDPVCSGNEESSIEYAKKFLGSSFTQQIGNLIFSTKDHVKYFDPEDKDMVWLHKNDLACFRHGAKIAETEKNIFKEYQFAPLEDFKRKRLGILNYYRKHPLISESVIDDTISFLSVWQPKFGIYCGSFNPFHRGHFDILKQAEGVFDKVIVAQGQNEDKQTSDYNIFGVNSLTYHEKDTYKDSLFSYLENQKRRLGDVSLVRGLRNGNDLHDESNLFNYSRDYVDVPFVYFVCKSENAHISSGSIRKLQILEKDVSKYLP